MTDRTSRQFLDKSRPPHIATLVMMSGASAMAMNMFLPSLPSMTAYFKTDYSTMQLSVALFLATNAVLQLIVGPLSDRFGRRPVLLGGFGIFVLATLGCLFAPSAEVFLAFRMIQSTIVVGLVLSRAIVRDLFEQDEAASMIGYVTMGMSIVPMITPALGGLLDEYFGWKATFWCFFVVGSMMIALIWTDCGETHRAEGQSLRDQLRDYPELLTSPRFWGYALATAFASGAFFAYLGGAPFVGTDVFGLSPALLGFFFGAPAVGYMAGNGVTGRLARRVGIQKLIFCGSLISCFGTAMALATFYAGLGSPYSFFGFMIFVGLGNGLVLPNAMAGILSVRPHLAGTASGLGGSMMIGGGAALSAYAGSHISSETGAFPLLWIMFTVSCLAVASILFVILRERRLGLA